jgi:ubiquinone biosynthesis protein COQ4
MQTETKRDDFHRRIRLADAATAMKALLSNPDDTAQVFRIIDALSGKNGERTLERVGRSKEGKRLLQNKPDLLARLRDREGLRKLPDGSLGRAYLAFLDSENITAEGLEGASVTGRNRDRLALPRDLRFLQDRLRDSHDLWHTLTGYKGDLVGEASLLAFSFAQTWNPGVGFIVSMALLRGRGSDVTKTILGGFVRGVKAAFLPAVEWEKLLALPLATVREQLRIGAPPVYDVIRSTDYIRAAA